MSQAKIDQYKKEKANRKANVKKAKTKKKLGLIGGMGPESTIPYYHDIVYGVQEALGESVFPELTIESVNVFKVLGLCGEWVNVPTNSKLSDKARVISSIY